MSIICAQQAFYSLSYFLQVRMLFCSRAVQQAQGRQMSVFQMANCQLVDARLKGTEGIHSVAEAKERHFLTHLVYVLTSQQLMQQPEKLQQPSSNGCLDSVRFLHVPNICLKFFLTYKKKHPSFGKQELKSKTYLYQNDLFSASSEPPFVS